MLLKDLKIDATRLSIVSLFKECTPKILIVTDGLNYDPNDDFGLTQFVDTLKGSTIHGMTPIVHTAHTGSDSNADFQNYDFDDSTNGVHKSRYDVLLMFGVARQGTSLPQPQLDAIMTFMEAGGGVFCTGDHEDLGASFGKDLPRIRNMRYWLAADTPDIGDTSRLSTNLAGDNGVFEFIDQSDVYPQKLYLNYRTNAGGIGSPHPLLQSTNFTELGYLPDHPHEGECRVPSNLTTTFDLNGTTLDEWPVESGGASRVAPEMVALSMSHGNSFPGKQALVPRSFIAITAYDGHLADKGRVSTDATWHHFINVNIDGTDTILSGLQDPPGTDTVEMEQIREYFINIADWLMPKNVRRCLRWPIIIVDLLRYPLFEEIRPLPIDKLTAEDFEDIGLRVKRSLSTRYKPWLVDAIIDDMADEVIGRENLKKFVKEGLFKGEIDYHSHSLSILGGAVMGLVNNSSVIKKSKTLSRNLAKVSKAGAETALKLKLKQTDARIDRYRKVVKALLK